MFPQGFSLGATRPARQHCGIWIAPPRWQQFVQRMYESEILFRPPCPLKRECDFAHVPKLESGNCFGFGGERRMESDVSSFQDTQWQRDDRCVARENALLSANVCFY